MSDERVMTVEDATRIEPMVITEEMVRIPSDMAYWNERYANVFQYWLEAKFARERTYSEAFRDIQERLATTSKTRVTVSEVEHLVATDRTYIDARMSEIVAESEKLRLGGVVEALRAKKDMLISLGAHMRAEMSSQSISTRWQP